MNLFNLPWLLIGAVIGLVVGFLLDYFFWRRRRVCSEREQELSVQVNSLKGDLDTQLVAYKGLEGDLATANGRITSLEADINAKNIEMEGLRGRADELSVFESNFEGTGWTLGGFLGGLTASGLWNRWRDRGGDIEYDAEFSQIGTLEADLSARDGKIRDLEFQVGRIGDLEADLQARDGRIAGLEADLRARDLEIEGLQAKVGGMQAKVDEVSDFEAKLGSRGLTLGSFFGGFTASSLWNRWTRDDAEAEIDIDAELGRLDLLEGDVEAKDQRIFELETQLGRLVNANVDLGTKAGDLDLMLGELDGKDARIFDLETQLNRDANLNVELTDVSTRLAALEAELVEKDDYIARLDADADGMVDLQADLFAKNTRLGDLEADLEAKNQSILSLEKDLTRLQMLEAELADRSYQVEGMQVQVETDIVDLEAKDQRIFELETQLSRLASANVDLGNRNLEFSSLAAGAAGAAAGAMAADDSDRVAELEGEVNRLNLLLASQKSPDDLTKVWGIGPKIAGLLNDNGITTFAQLANTDVDTISGYMEAAGPRYRLSDPKILGTWSQQASMAADGEWDGLKAYQATLKRTEVANPLRKIWGVGAKTEGILNGAGVNSFDDLLGATEASLDSAIDSAKGYYPGLDRDGIFRSWMEQARLGVDNKWAQLRGFQQQYRTGRRRDDLTRLWGIGPGLASLFNRRGINSYEELNDLSAEQAAEIVKESGITKAQLPNDYYNVWLTQSNFAVSGDWDGRDSFMRGLRKDDLKLIWGIGPKIESILNNNGITTFEALSQTNPDRIDEMLEEAGSRFNLSTENLHETWISQARLADIDDWVAFQTLYDSLTWDNVQDEE
ncbi:MAG: helix-hairpin-helix domain-containing protein [Chloroflexota bacterium]